MDWSNERYVRLYTRDTPEWLVMPWQGRAVWPLVIRKLDRSGVLATKLGVRGVAVLIAMPVEVVEPGIAALLEDGCLEVHRLGYVAPNFLPAQEAASSDAHRAREYRERRRGVTKRDANVTGRHDASQTVTPSLAVPSVPSRAEPTQGGECGPGGPRHLALVSPETKPKTKPKRSDPQYTNDERAGVALVLGKLSDRNQCAYQASKAHTALIVSRLRAGYTTWDMRRVIAYCADELGWQDDAKMRAYLRPETLFGPETMERYVHAARSWMPNQRPPEEIQEDCKQIDRANDDTAMTGPRWEEPEWMTTMTK